MAVYERTVYVEAPLEAVWELHSRPSGLEVLSPPWLGLRVESATGPDGEPDPPVLETGSQVSLSVKPCGVGPRRTVTARIVARERGSETASFEDVALDGPFARWRHVHAFGAEGDGTRVVDRVAYDLAECPAGSVLDELAKPGFDAAFRARHRRTKALLERDEG